MPWIGVGMINYGMTALMKKVINLKIAWHYHGMLMRMYQKKTGISYLRTVNAVTLMAFKFLLRDLYEKILIKNFVPFY